MSYQPDGLGRATRASDASRIYASNAAYHPSGGLTALSYGNGHAFTASYNARQLMSAMQVSGGGVIAVSFAYNHDAGGRITSITDLAVTGQNRSFTYDGLGRLTSATGPWGSGSYTYDALNNLLTRTLGSRVVEMEYNASNRLHRHRDTGDGHVWRNYAYDSRGNVTHNGTIGFTYDRAERPVSISGGASGSFTYDAHGRRVKQVVGGQTIYSVYSASGTLLYRDNATTGAATDYIRMGGRAIARVRGSDVEWTYADHLGSPAAAASQTGAILWREDHTPFGEARQAPAGNADNEGFTGHIADAASGLVYMQARYYDPVVGRFLSNDPVGFVEGGVGHFNRYAYTANDAVNYVDPDGEQRARPVGQHRNLRFSSPWTRYRYEQAQNRNEELARELHGNAPALLPPTNRTILPSDVRSLERANSSMERMLQERSNAQQTRDPLQVGRFASRSIPARDSGRNFRSSERNENNQTFRESGCHTCGTRDPGTRSGNAILDHQPVTALSLPGTPQRLYPQCAGCSRQQGGRASAELRRRQSQEP